MPNPEELKYFIALKDVIAGKMGPWQSGDRYFCPNDKRGYAPKAKFIENGYFDSMQYDSEHKLGAWVIPEPCCPDVAIPLPLPIDPENPERGLVGMIKGTWAMKYTNVGCTNNGVYELHFLGCNRGVLCVREDTPTLALLKALARQEGIEVTP